MSAIAIAVLLTFGQTELEWAKANWARYVPSEQHVEVVQWDRTRVDYLSPAEAIEIDWAPKWAEAIGQSLYYAELTHRRPAIVLLVKDLAAEAKYVYRCQTVCVKHGIRLYVEQVNDDERN